MNVTIKFKDLAPDVQEALRARAVAENKPISDVSREALNEALGPKSKRKPAAK